MTTIYLIRHSEPDYTVHDDLQRPLTVKGRENCKKVTSYLMDKQIDIVLSSPYIRAVDTVRDFADTNNMQIHTIYKLRERAVDATWIENFSEFVELQWKDFSYHLNGGECLREVQNRCIEAIHDLLENQNNKNIVIGSHGTAISAIINYYDKAYGLEHFNKIKGIMPFAAKMNFDGQECRSIEMIDILGDTEKVIYTSSLISM